LIEITNDGSYVLIMCLVAVWRHYAAKHRPSTYEPSFVISIKYRPSLPDDGSYVIRNMLE